MHSCWLGLGCRPEKNKSRTLRWLSITEFGVAMLFLVWFAHGVRTNMPYNFGMDLCGIQQHHFHCLFWLKLKIRWAVWDGFITRSLSRFSAHLRCLERWMLANICHHGHPQNPSLNQIRNLKLLQPRSKERKQARFDDRFIARWFDAACYLPRDIIWVGERNVATCKTWGDSPEVSFSSRNRRLIFGGKVVSPAMRKFALLCPKI